MLQQNYAIQYLIIILQEAFNPNFWTSELKEVAFLFSKSNLVLLGFL